MKKAGKTTQRNATFSITVPETLARRIEKKLGDHAADSHSRYFTELATKDIASGGDVSRATISG